MIIRKLLVLFCCVFWLITAVANSNVNTNITFVTITNNTKEIININSILYTKDSAFQRGKDWDGNALTLSPYETKQVLWFSRNTDVKINELYQFDLVVSNLIYPGYQVKLSLIERGKPIYGSDI